MSEIVGTGLSVEDARMRLAARFPRRTFGSPWSIAPRYVAEERDDGFAVRALPRLTGSPLFEAVGRWREGGGAVVEVAPLATAYAPLVLANTAVLVILFGGALVFGARSNIQGAIQGAGAGALLLIIIALLVQLTLLALVERRTGDAERATLLAIVRETLGP
jgi:hypothetical protein